MKNPSNKQAWRVLVVVMVLLLAMVIISLAFEIKTAIQIQKDANWCRHHDGVYVRHHCLDKKAVIK